MKYCTKCGNQLEDEMLFCQKCGTKCYQEVYTNTPEPNDYKEYWGLSYKDIESGRTISLTPDGIHIYKKSFIPLMSTRADKIIPYAEVIDVVSKRATALSSGYISILTVTDGVDQKANRTMLLQDTNTALFKRKNEPEIERIYRAIRDICNLGTGTYESNINSLSNQPKTTSNVKILIPIFAVVLIFMLIVLPKNNTSNDKTNESSPQQTETVKTGEDYEGDVFTAFWEGASESFGVEYSDYKFAHTSYSWIEDFTTTDGYTAHYYLIQTAFETKNAFGQKILHPVTARCYYVPEYSNTVYTTYMTLDGETILFDEEKEDWLMGMGGNSTPSNTSYVDDNVTVYDYSAEQSETDYSNYDITEYDNYNEETYYEDDEFDYSNDDLEYMREVAEMEWLNEFTSEEIIVEDYDEPERDLDGIVTNLSPEEYEELQNSAMGE